MPCFINMYASKVGTKVYFGIKAGRRTAVRVCSRVNNVTLLTACLGPQAGAAHDPRSRCPARGLTDWVYQ